MKIRIITDSGCDLLPPYPSCITVLPLTITFGTESFLDGVDLDHHRFYEKLIEGEDLPTTSQIAPAAFGDAFRAAVEAAAWVRTPMAPTTGGAAPPGWARKARSW